MTQESRERERLAIFTYVSDCLLLIETHATGRDYWLREDAHTKIIKSLPIELFLGVFFALGLFYDGPLFFRIRIRGQMVFWRDTVIVRCKFQ